jgi:UDP-N-acetyl-D-glucosamine dehydrogenase
MNFARWRNVSAGRRISLPKSPSALDVIHLLEEKGAVVSYHDPHVPHFHHEGMEMASAPDLDAALAEADCVVIATDHSAYDWEEIASKSSLVVDTRRVV